jgi:hypothetical protein
LAEAKRPGHDQTEVHQRLPGAIFDEGERRQQGQRPDEGHERSSRRPAPRASSGDREQQGKKAETEEGCAGGIEPHVGAHRGLAHQHPDGDRDEDREPQ